MILTITDIETLQFQAKLPHIPNRLKKYKSPVRTLGMTQTPYVVNRSVERYSYPYIKGAQTTHISIYKVSI